MSTSLACAVFCVAIPCAGQFVEGPPLPPVPISVSGDWSLRVGPGTVARDGRVAVLAEAVELAVPPAVSVVVRDEKHERLPLFNPAAGGWAKGARLRGVVAEECTAKGMLDPATFRLKAGPGPDAEVLAAPKDYDIDLEWGTFGRVAGGRVAEGSTVWADYTHGLSRLDSVVLDSGGKVALRSGAPAAALQRPPTLEPGDVLLANLWVRGRAPRLAAHDVFPVLESAYPEAVREGPSAAERLLPATLQKLRQGGRVRILAWGDSVTDGSYLGDGTKRWQCRFADRLGKRFPKASIEVIHLGWGGRSTDSFLAEPPGSPWNYREKVLAAKPDLVVSEFVNDAWMGPKEVDERYGRFLADFREIGAEWIILTPHYVRPDWMGLDREREIDDDPRPYVKGLREFAARRGVALADASLRWGRLWRQGIPYMTLLGNAINHPDARGMEIFADALLELFP